MNTLHIALQDGFDNDLVVISLDGQEILRQERVRTDPRINLAQAFDTSVTQGPVQVNVTLPQKGITQSLTVDPDTSAYVAVSVYEGSIRFKTSHQPFGYL